MVPGLNQFPPLLAPLSKELLQPLNAAWIGIVNKTKAILITGKGSGLFFSRGLRELVNRNLIFPLRHIFPFLKCLYTQRKSYPHRDRTWDFDMIPFLLNRLVDASTDPLPWPDGPSSVRQSFWEIQSSSNPGALHGESLQERFQ